MRDLEKPAAAEGLTGGGAGRGFLSRIKFTLKKNKTQKATRRWPLSQTSLLKGETKCQSSQRKVLSVNK